MQTWGFRSKYRYFDSLSGTHERTSFYQVRANIGSHFKNCHKNIHKNINCLTYWQKECSKERARVRTQNSVKKSRSKSGPPFLVLFWASAKKSAWKIVLILVSARLKWAWKMSESELKKKERTTGLVSCNLKLVLQERRPLRGMEDDLGNKKIRKCDPTLNCQWLPVGHPNSIHLHISDLKSSSSSPNLNSNSSSISNSHSISKFNFNKGSNSIKFKFKFMFKFKFKLTLK